MQRDDDNDNDVYDYNNDEVHVILLMTYLREGHTCTCMGCEEHVQQELWSLYPGSAGSGWCFLQTKQNQEKKKRKLK